MKRDEHHALALHRGFTLIELVIIIVVLGILAAVAIPNFSGVSDDAKKAKASAIFGSLKASYATQKAIKKGGAVSVGEIVAGHDPGCSGVTLTETCGDSATVTFGTGTAAAVTAPSTWSCTVSGIAGSTC